MMSLLWRYLASSFVVPLSFGTIFFVLFILTFQLFRIMRIVAAKQVDFWLILKLITFMGVSLLPLAVPIAAFFTTFYIVNRMSEDSEIVAMRSFGLSKYRLLSPFMFIAVGVSFSLFLLGSKIVPRAERIFKNEMIRISSSAVLSDITPETFFTEIPGVTLFAQKVSKGGANLEKVFIHSIKKSQERIILANHGHLIKKTLPNGADDLRLFLKDGNILSISSDAENEKVLFKTYDFPILDSQTRVDSVSKNSMLTNKELHEKISNFKGGSDKRSYLKASLELLNRYNNPIVVLVFVFSGFAFGFKSARGRDNTGGKALLFLVAFYLLYFTGVGMAKKGNISSYIAVFTPTLLFFSIALKRFFKIDWSN